ncbi:MAG TPA: TRAP transporter substrate-binding protein DctP [Myxococcales bacterium]|jgi:TRAP-type C4-dicarboxylate transport system substrate-binding protein|nr:TRAP transporter substrate-binding protein DctP [Myxococcales bacterium]
MKRLAPFLALLCLSAGAASAQTVRIKLGTLAPQGSTWHQLLQQMAQDFSKASGGKVELKIYAGGTQGSEGEMIRKMSIGQLQASSITAIGLHEITPEPQAEDVPFMIDSYEEYEYVHDHIRAKLEEAIAKKGFQVLQWGEVGFVYFFSTEPYKTPADFAKGKVFTWNGDPGAEAAWKAAGFHPVVLSSTDLVPAITSGMIDIVGQSPLYIYTTNLYSKADNMLDMHWGFLTGATVVKKETWAKIAPDVQQKLLQIAEDYGKRTREDVRKQNDDAVQQMKKRGLTVVAPADVEGWQRAAEQANKVVRGKVVPAAIYDEVKRLRDEYRAQHKR